jgi:hypothetical protein
MEVSHVTRFSFNGLFRRVGGCMEGEAVTLHIVLHSLYGNFEVLITLSSNFSI